MSKGGAKVAQQNAGIGQSYSQGYQGDASGISGTELPFLQNELTNPQGFDPTDLSKMRTSSSQSIAGAEGAGRGLVCPQQMPLLGDAVVFADADNQVGTILQRSQ